MILVCWCPSVQVPHRDGSEDLLWLLELSPALCRNITWVVPTCSRARESCVWPNQGWGGLPGPDGSSSTCLKCCGQAKTQKAPGGSEGFNPALLRTTVAGDQQQSYVPGIHLILFFELLCVLWQSALRRN